MTRKIAPIAIDPLPPIPCPIPSPWNSSQLNRTGPTMNPDSNSIPNAEVVEGGSDPDDVFPDIEDDAEVDALNEALGDDPEGQYLRNQSGEILFYSHPERERCGGHGYMICYCGGDLCVCGNQGEIECYGCADCDGPKDDDDFGDFDDD